MSAEDPHPLPYDTRRFPWSDRPNASVWPNEARMAVLFYLAAEAWEWDEEEPGPPIGNRRDEYGTSLSTRTGIEYGFRVGLRRLDEVFADHGLATTVFTTGNAVEQFPGVIADLADAGHEISGHAYSEGVHVTAMDRESTRDAVRRSADLIESCAGDRPVGWLGPGGIADVKTIEILADEGFEYNADLQDDELPYFIDVGDNTLVEIPFRMVGYVNDYGMPGFARGTRDSLETIIAALTGAFDAHYRVASRTPLVLVFGIHPYVSGRPDSSYVLSEFIDYIQRYDDVWIPTYREAAAWWRDRFGDGYAP